MQLQKFNYHTHTYLCGHAVGSAEDMIQAAIKGGFTTIGISEHMGYEGWHVSYDRLEYEDMQKYLDMMYALKEKYKDAIDVRVGFESEFFHDSIEHLLYFKDKCDYLICGQHCPDRKSKDYNVPPYDSDEYIEFMAEQICDGIKLGLFKYIAHPDYFMLSGCEYSQRKKDAIRKIAECAKEHDVVLEINLKGTKYGSKQYDFGESYLYPNTETFRIIGEVGTKVCFGYDAHHPNDLIDRREIEFALKEKFKDFHLHFVEDLTL